MEETELVREARRILSLNWKSGYTIPRAGLYPFQWNWDSGFIALGWSHFDPGRAIAEFTSLFSGQWQNGMLPHIIFHSEKEATYFPNYDFWEANVNPGAPEKPKTSGISQPPVHAIMLDRILERHGEDPEWQAFAEAIFDPLLRMHRWWYAYRDPLKEGLVAIIHPWESGRDNSPLWDWPMDKIDLSKEVLPPYQRKDTAHADAAERPTNEHYDKYVFLLELAKKYRYDGPEILAESPFCVQDTMMNAILISANDSLVRIGKSLGRNTDEIEAWNRKAKKAYCNKLWNDETGSYCCFDLRNGTQIQAPEIGAFVAFLAGIPDDKAARLMHQQLISWHRSGFFLVPSFDPAHPFFDSKRYWRGPVWPQMNWLIYQGLKRYGMDDAVRIVRDDLISLVRQMGFYEYFEPQKEPAGKLSKGYGGSLFSWTAAVILDFIYAP